jgi:sigma-B regulation protein RsbU (phosphoserine phosphatase)
MASFRPSAMPVGILDTGEFVVQASMLRPGDKLVIFSDGLTEAQNGDGRYFETGRIRQVLEQSAGLSAQAVHAALMSAVGAFAADQPQSDDMTLVVAEFTPPAC